MVRPYDGDQQGDQSAAAASSAKEASKGSSPAITTAATQGGGALAASHNSAARPALPAETAGFQSLAHTASHSVVQTSSMRFLASPAATTPPTASIQACYTIVKQALAFAATQPISIGHPNQFQFPATTVQAADFLNVVSLD